MPSSRTCAGALALTASLLAPATAAATVIDFDEVAADCCWSGTEGPLTTRYTALGVRFAGPAPGDGGGILDEAGSFGSIGHSSPNFLAFNDDSIYAGGGEPTQPETLFFDPPVTEVSMITGSSQPGFVSLTAFNDLAGELDSDIIVLTPDVQVLSVSGTEITSVVIDSDATYFIVDDITFDGATVVEPTLEILEVCPGPVQLNFTGFSPAGAIAVLSGDGPGADVLPGGPCVGIISGLTGLGLQTTFSADVAGTKTATPDLDAAACGKWLQGLDVNTCTLSPAVEIP